MPQADDAVIEITEIDDELNRLFDEDFLQDVNAVHQRYETPGDFLRRAAVDAAQPVAPKRIIIYDLVYPDEFEVAEGLRAIPELREAARDAYLIVYTAAPLENVRRQAIDLGANTVLQKSRDNPESIRDLVRLWRGQEVVRASALCEVVEVDEDNGRVRVQIPGRDGWVAERTFDLDFCPPPAREVGGAFWLDTIERPGRETKEYVIRARTVDREEEQALLARFPE